MKWLQISLSWYSILFVLGLVFVPLTKKIFGRFFYDLAYPFSKTVGILLLSYAIFVLGIFKLVPFGQMSLVLLGGAFFILNYYLFRKEKSDGYKQQKSKLALIIFEEGLFLISLLLWAYIRGQEPSIRGLEKFMDFGFINSILRSKYFPPLDMWLSADPSRPTGYPINYYYFGHLTGAVLIKLTGITPSIGYNLILATIFALGVTQIFSLVINLFINFMSGLENRLVNGFKLIKTVFLGLMGAYIVNLAGNLHTIYLFTTGYPNESPVPFWQILRSYNPIAYWYPNATRFIPFTIHEFPIYSYVVADLHGHVFDIPFVILTLAVLFRIINTEYLPAGRHGPTLNTIFLGFLIAIHYMTNAFDGLIYLALSALVLLMVLRNLKKWLVTVAVLIAAFFLFSLPFSINFSPFATGVGLNCSPGFLTKIGKIGPFIFESGNCQVSPPWMLFVLWGFFLVNFILFIILNFIQNNKVLNDKQSRIVSYIFLLFAFGTFLIIVPEFFYIKDIYPAHFRANTMFKLGYQAFIMMGIASTFAFFQIKLQPKLKAIFLTIFFTLLFFLVAIYPFFAVPSYYGKLDREVELDGAQWLIPAHPGDAEIIGFLNTHVKGSPVILEAQGDSYTDYERISAYTGLPTVAGWWVHEWLWRGSADVVGERIPDVVNLYESKDISLTKNLINKYQVEYIIVSELERQKYPGLYEEKFSQIGKKIYQAKSERGAVYQVNPDEY
jgi:uncharacterized membrane protein